VVKENRRAVPRGQRWNKEVQGFEALENESSLNRKTNARRIILGGE